jgi:hypothetical protein
MRKGRQKRKMEIVMKIIKEQNRPISANEIVSLAPRQSGLTSASVSQLINKRLKDEIEVCGSFSIGGHSSKVNLYKLRDKDECTTTNS